MELKRKTGFYWIVYKDEYQVAKYNAVLDEWHLIGLEADCYSITDEDIVIESSKLEIEND